MITIKALAKKLKIHDSTLRRLCRAGLIKAKKVGRDWVVISLNGFVAKKQGRPKK